MTRTEMRFQRDQIEACRRIIRLQVLILIVLTAVLALLITDRTLVTHAEDTESLLSKAPITTEILTPVSGGAAVLTTEEAAAENPLYLVDGAMLSEELQQLLYTELERYGIEWFYPYAMCQIYQESRFKASAISKNGLDRGLCQFRITYFQEFADDAGYPTADIFDPEDSIKVYAHLMHKYLMATDTVEMALSYYYMGEKKYCGHYVNEVMQWWDTLQKIR